MSIYLFSWNKRKFGYYKTQFLAKKEREIIMIEYYYGEHALDQLHERQIEIAWVDRTLKNPDHVEFLERKNKIYYYAKIREFGNRYLKVVVNIRSKPYKIATIHFDRRIGRRI